MNDMPKVLEPSSRPKAFHHVLHLKGPVESCEYYADWIDTIRNAGPEDSIDFHINTPGGSVYTAIELMTAFAESQAQVNVIISGLCASAGTMLMTVGDSFEIAPGTTFMFHNYSGGTIGKGNEMHVKMEYERKWSKDFLHSVYEHVLTSEEIDQVLDGRDFWLPAEDVAERLTNLIEKRQMLMEEAMAEIENAIKEAHDAELEAAVKEAKEPKKKPAKRKPRKKATKKED